MGSNLSDSSTSSAIRRCTSRMLTGSSIAARRQRCRTGAGRRARWRPAGIVEDHRKEGFLRPPFFVQLQEARDVHVQRARVLARRECEVLAHARTAAPRQDVVFEFLPEVAQVGENGVRSELAETTQRSVADHPAQFVEGLEILKSAEPSVMLLRMRSALSRPTRHGTHLPQLSSV